MSILIKGMEMPTSCLSCPLQGGTADCRLTQKTYNWGLSERPSDCPLVPVPTPHGRLIDKDVICNECRRIAEEYDGIYPDCTYCPAHLAPTVIPAEEGE